ncbi:MAG: Lcl C-terminal domain-containing protein [Pseudobdellovibrionaceae bacterium]
MKSIKKIYYTVISVLALILITFFQNCQQSPNKFSNHATISTLASTIAVEVTLTTEPVNADNCNEGVKVVVSSNFPSLVDLSYSFDGGQSWNSLSYKIFNEATTLPIGQIIVKDKNGSFGSNKEAYKVDFVCAPVSPVSQADPCMSNPTPGTVCAGGAIYLGSLSPGATSGSGTDRYMTTPGGCGEIPDGQRVITNFPFSDYPNADFTPTCSGLDSLSKTWNDGSTNWFDISGLINYETNIGVGFGSTNTDQYYGSDNTTNIAAIVSPGQGGYHAAARYCDKLSYGGYTDWYLPNRYELNLMYTNAAFIPGLDTTGSSFYWSSTEYTNTINKADDSAWYQRFSDGLQSINTKNSNFKIRCIRRY